MPWVETVSGPPVSADQAELASPVLSLLAIINSNELLEIQIITHNLGLWSTHRFVRSVNSQPASG